MRVALVHNFYRSSAPSGEDEVVRSEQRLLESAGIEVISFTRHNDDLRSGALGALGASLSNAWSFDSLDALRRLIAATRPEVAHFHNTFPLVSPAAYHAWQCAQCLSCRPCTIYRQSCRKATYYRERRVCTQCHGKVPSCPGSVHACHRCPRCRT